MASEMPDCSVTDAVWLGLDIVDEDYTRICDYVYRKIGLVIGQNKKSMVASRLAKRLRLHGLEDFGEYFERAVNGSLAGEEQVMVDLLTTNETYLFREPAHFVFLRDQVLAEWDKRYTFRAWSAACSTGEEVYSLAMEAQEKLGESAWEIVGSDVNSGVLPVARTAKYTTERSDNIPLQYLRDYCKKGVNSESGALLISRKLRDRVYFRCVNLVQQLPEDLGQFDVIFLRNVLIYFDERTRRKMVGRVMERLKIGGYFFVSHTETIAGLSTDLKLVRPSIYQKLPNEPTELAGL